MESFEKDIKLHNLQKSLKIETEFEQPIEDLIIKADGDKIAKDMAKEEEEEANQEDKSWKEAKDMKTKVTITPLEKGGEGSRGGKIIGHTRGGNPIYEKELEGYGDYKMSDHKESIEQHLDAIKSGKNKEHHGKYIEIHKQLIRKKTPNFKDTPHHQEQMEKYLKEVNEKHSKILDKAVEDELEKARSGIYKNTPENRKQGIAGERYGNMIHGGSTQHVEPIEGDIKMGEKFNHDGCTWKVIKVGVTQSRAECITKSNAGKLLVLDNKVIAKNRVAKEEKSNFPNPAEIGKLRQESSGLSAGKFHNPGRQAPEIGKRWKAIEDTLQKAFEEGLISKEALEKARSGIYAPTSENKKKGVVGQKYGEKKQEEQPKGKEGEQKPLTEEDLKQHATQSSEQALTNAIKQSPDPIVRQVAHTELQRRQKEEKPTDDKGEFPSKEFQESTMRGRDPKTGQRIAGKKEVDPSQSHEKKEQPLDVKNRDPKTGQMKKHDSSDKEYDELSTKHKKERDEHQKKSQAYYDEFNSKHKELSDRHSKERLEAMHSALRNPNNKETETKFKELTSKHDTEWKEHNEKHSKAQEELNKKWNEIGDRHSKEKDAFWDKYHKSKSGQTLSKEDSSKLKEGAKQTKEASNKLDKNLKQREKEKEAYKVKEAKKADVKKDSGIKKSIQGIQYF